MITIPAGEDVNQFVELRFKPGSWEKGGIPERECRMRTSALEQILEQRGAYAIDDLILGLMDWLDVTDRPEPALATLRRLLDRHYPSDGRQSARCHFVDEQGVDRIFHTGSIELDDALVAWQRRDWVIAAGQASSEPGRIIVEAPGPISTETALRILSVSMLSYMGEPFDSFLGAQTSCGSTAVFYSWEAGRVTPVRWDEGLSAEAVLAAQDGDEESPTLARLPPNQLARQVAIAAGYLN